MLDPSERFTYAREILAQHLLYECVLDKRYVLTATGQSFVNPREKVFVREITPRAAETMFRAAANTA